MRHAHGTGPLGAAGGVMHPGAGKTIEDVNVGWALLWDRIKRFVVDRRGRAILDGGHVLMPMLGGQATARGSEGGSRGSGGRSRR